MDADYAKRTERIKNLLSSYYGTGDGSQPGTPSGSAAAHGATSEDGSRGRGAAAGASGAATLDSIAYNADRHISGMIRSAPLDKLLAEHRSMAREIKNLDSDMQQLVYENYNKFITATDTIRTLKVNVDGMESSMDQLKGIMDDVASKSTAVNLKLQRRRQHVEELQQVAGLMAKLQAILGLPARMRAALEEDALDSAVSFYAEAAPLLRKWGGGGALRGVAAEAELVAGDIGRRLKARLAERKGEAEGTVLLLRKLGEGDDSLQDKYLQGRTTRLSKVLGEGCAVMDWMEASSTPLHPTSSTAPTAAAAAAGVPVGVEAPEEWGCGEATLGARLAGLLKALDERVLGGVAETAANVTGIFLQDDKAAGRRKPLVAACRGVMEEYFRVVRRAVAVASREAAAVACRTQEAAAEPSLSPGTPSTSFSSDWGADMVLDAVATLTTDVGQLAGALPELGLKELAAGCGRALVVDHVGACAAALRGRVAGGVAQLAAALAAAAEAQGEQAGLALLQPAYAHLTQLLDRGLPALMQGLKPYEAAHKQLAEWRDELADGVQGALAGLLLGLGADGLGAARIKADVVFTGHNPSSTTASYSGGATPSPPPSSASPAQPPAVAEGPRSGLLLLLAKLVQHVEGVVVPGVMEALGGSTWGRAGRAARGDEPPVFMAGEVARRLGTAANLLLGGYVDAHARALSSVVRRSVASTSWAAAAEPRGPRPVCDLLLERLGRAEAEVGRLVEASGRGTGEAGRRPGESGHHHTRSGSNVDALGSTGAVERGVAKLFREKVRVFGEVRLTQAALLGAMASAALQSLVEGVRLQTLGRAGLQQLQLDMFYLRPRLLRLVGASSGAPAEALAQLADEVVAAAAERCTQPVLLEAGTLERLLAAAAASERD